MKPYVKMMLMEHGKKDDHERRDGSRGYTGRETEYDMGMRDERREYDRPGMGGDYEIDNRFNDRRGRRHYDDGRYAPMPSRRGGRRGARSEGGGDMEMYEGGDRGGNRGGSMEMNNYRGGRSPRMGDDDDDDEEMRGDYRPLPTYTVPPYGGGNEMNEIGFERGMRAEHSGRNEMENRWSEKESGHARGYEEFNHERAKEWTKQMRNEDGTTGPHWTMDQVKQVMKQHGIDHDAAAFWAIINSIYSDYCAVFKKHGVNTMEMYIDMAKAWLNDKDAVKDKAGAYFDCVVKH